MSENAFRIWVVDDDPADVEILKLMLTESGLAFEMEVSDDGEKASRAWSNRDAARPLPDVVLLDLNLPKKSGRDVLEEIKADPAARDLPVIVLTTFASPADLAAFARFKNTTSLLKPPLLDEYAAVVQTIRAALAKSARPSQRDAA